MEFKIAASILNCDFAHLADEIKIVEDAGADLLHIDVLDGHFAPNISLGPMVVESLRKVTRLPFDVHLMIYDPEKYIDKFIDAGADIITLSCESTIHIHRAIQMVKNRGARVGLALNPATPVCFLENVYDELDQVLLMTVNPGFGGQVFIKSCLEKINLVRERIDLLNKVIELAVDGGIGPETIQAAAKAGANIFIAGTAIYRTKNPKNAISELKSLASLSFR